MISTQRVRCNGTSIANFSGALFNVFGPSQNGRHFPNDIFKCIFPNENVWISTKISLKIVPYLPTDNKTALVQIMAWLPTGDSPLSETVMAFSLTHISITRLQRFKSLINWLHGWGTIDIIHCPNPYLNWALLAKWAPNGKTTELHILPAYWKYSH